MKRIFLMLLAYALALPAVAQAEPPTPATLAQQLQQCLAEAEDLPRLACYDALAQSAGKPTAVEHPPKANRWQLSSASTGSNNRSALHLSLYSSSVAESSSIRGTGANRDRIATENRAQSSLSQSNVSQSNADQAILTLSCEASKSSVSINWGRYLGIGSIRMKTYFDGQSNRSKIWSIADDNQTIILSGSDISFIKQLMRHQSLTTEITPFGERPITASFAVAGLAEAIKPLRKACRW